MNTGFFSEDFSENVLNSGNGEAGHSNYGGHGNGKRWSFKRFFRPKNKIVRAILASVSCLLAVAIVGLAGLEVFSLANGNRVFAKSTSAVTSDKVINPNGPSLKTVNQPATSTPTTSQMDTEQIYSNVRDSIVTIETYSMQSVEPSAEGSGIIMSSDGYIITNEHVIDGANSIQVVLSNNKQYDAKVVGSDVKTDLAVLKINATGLKAATFGNSDQLKVAEPVLAIGNPGGIEFSGSVTEGIVSAVSRTITTEAGYSENCIQTDAAINPGNSGGALVNMAGQVVGITSSKLEAEGFESMGFAIPINTAQPVVNDIIKYGYVTGRVKIGISVAQFDSGRATVLGYPSGLLVESVDSSSDAAAKGIQVDDIITKINGTAAASFDQFYQAESKYKPGDTVTLTVFRYSTGKTFDVSVKLAEDKGNNSTTQQNNRQSNRSGYGYGFSNTYSNGNTANDRANGTQC